MRSFVSSGESGCSPRLSTWTCTLFLLVSCGFGAERQPVPDAEPSSGSRGVAAPAEDALPVAPEPVLPVPTTPARPSEANEPASPRRRALLVGINDYPGFPAQYQLRGCGNDADAMRTLLRDRYGFAEADIHVLRNEEATYAALRAALERLIQESGPQDVAVFAFSGNGSQVTDRNGDEQDDKVDEVLCAHDFRLRGDREGENGFSDDELDELVRDFRGQQFVAIFDCCYSSTGLRSVGAGGRVRSLSNTQIPAVAMRGLVFEEKRAAVPGDGTEACAGMDLSRGVRGVGSISSDARRQPVPVVLLAACPDHELAGEIPESSRSDRVVGVWTQELIIALEGAADRNGNGEITFAELEQHLLHPLINDLGTQNPRIEVASALLTAPVFGPHPRPVHPSPTPKTTRPAQAPNYSIRLLRVALVSSEEINLPGADAEATGRLRNYLLAQLRGETRFLRLESAQSACEALIVCDAVREYGTCVYRVALKDGYGRQVTSRSVSRMEDVWPGLRAALLRLHTVRNLLRLQQVPESPYRVEIHLDKPFRTVYHRNERMQFVCRSNRPGYLTLINITNENCMTVLYPNPWSGGIAKSRIDAERPITLPPAEMGFSFPVEPPFGDEVLRAFVTPEPLDLSSVGFDPTKDYGTCVPLSDSSVGQLAMALSRAIVARPVSSNASTHPRPTPVGFATLAEQKNWGTATLFFTTAE